MFFTHSDPVSGHLDFLCAWTSVLINRHLFLTVSETGKSKFRMPAWSGSGEGPPSTSPMGSFLLYPHLAKRGSSVVSSSKSANPFLGVLLLWLHLNLQFSSVAQLCPTLCDPMSRSTSGLPVHHHLPEFTQTHVHQVRDAIQPSHPLSSPSPPAPNPSQHQSLFQWVNTLHEVAKVLEF